MAAPKRLSNAQMAEFTMGGLAKLGHWYLNDAQNNNTLQSPWTEEELNVTYLDRYAKGDFSFIYYGEPGGEYLVGLQNTKCGSIRCDTKVEERRRSAPSRLRHIYWQTDFMILV